MALGTNLYLSPSSSPIVIWIGLAVLSAGLSTATVDQVRQHVEYLASDQLDGRLTGTAGERLAADYLVRQLEQIGARPLRGRESFELPFEFTAGSSDAVLPNLDIILDVAVDRERRIGHNIVGMLPGRSGAELEKPYVVLGAHYDHLGRGGSGGNSLARKDEIGGIHHGADDNASGVAAVLAAAAQLAKMDRQRDVVLAFWSGEELGALGSHDFLASEAIDPDQIAAYVNLDMVGRVRDNTLVLQAVGTSSVWPRLIEQSNIPVGFDLQTRDDPYLPTDTLNFVQAGIPTLDLFTGSHEEYHRPADRAETLNYEDLERVARFGALVIYKTANLETAPDFIEVERDPQAGGGREGARIFTGTIPDYTAEVEGLRLSGVIGGGPAEEAGLQEGDVVVKLAGQSVTNVYDYMYALEALEIGKAVKVIFLRDGNRQETTITPQSRK